MKLESVSKSLKAQGSRLKAQGLGFTIVELVITISLIAVLVIPTAFIVSELLRTVMRSRDSAIALNLARYEMERLDSIDDFFADPDLAPNPRRPWWPRTTIVAGYQNTTYTMERVIGCLVGNCRNAAQDRYAVKRVDVTIYKPNPSGDIPLATLITYRTKHVRYGL